MDSRDLHESSKREIIALCIKPSLYTKSYICSAFFYSFIFFSFSFSFFFFLKYSSRFNLHLKESQVIERNIHQIRSVAFTRLHSFLTLLIILFETRFVRMAWVENIMYITISILDNWNSVSTWISVISYYQLFHIRIIIELYLRSFYLFSN